MSAVSIPFFGDPSGAYAALNAFRAEASKPITIPLTGAQSFTPGAVAPSAPVTFGSGGFTPFTQSPTLAGLGGGTFNFGNGAGFAGFASGGNAAGVGSFGGGGGGGGAQQLNQATQSPTSGGAGLGQAAQTMQQAAATMLQAAQAIQGGQGPLLDDSGGGGEGSSGGGGGGRRGFSNRGPLGFGRLTRLATLGYAAYEAVRIGESYLKASDEKQFADFQFGAGSPSSTLAKTRSDLSFLQSIPLSTGLSALGKFRASGKSFNEDYEESIYNQEQAIKDRQNDAGIIGSFATSSAGIRSIGRAALAVGTTGFARQRALIGNSVQDAGDQFKASEYSTQLSIDALRKSDPREADRQQDVLNQTRLNDSAKLSALRNKAVADVGEVNRQYRLELLNTSGQASAAEFGASGNFGQQSNAQFDLQQQIRLDAARVSDPSGVLASITANLNRNESQARLIQQQQVTAIRDADTRSNRFIIANDPLSATINSIDSRRASELSNATSSDDRRSIDAKFNSQIDRARFGFKQTTENQRFVIRSSTQRLDILNDQSSDPSTAAARAQVFDIVNNAEKDLRAAQQSGRLAALSPDIQANLGAEANQLQIRRLNAITAEEVDPTRQALSEGNTTENLSDILTSIDEGLKQFMDFMKNQFQN